MKKIPFIIATLMLLFVSCNSIDTNAITVTVKGNLAIDSVKIQYGFYSINEDTDKNLVDKGLGETVFEKNKLTPFTTICGENDFLITYANTYYVKVRHLIPNDFVSGIPDKHIYNFKVVTTKNGLLLKLNIVGTDGETITRKFAKVKEASTNRNGKKAEKCCNTVHNK